jgi:predicted amidohydrolase YtcJ
MLLYNARIYTLDPNRPTATAIIIDRERILAVGDGLAQDSILQSSCDLGGRVIIPGLTDAHIHLQSYALSLQKVDCETPTRAECLRRVAERVRRTPVGEWILGHGWNQNEWDEPLTPASSPKMGEGGTVVPEGNFPSAADLDAISLHHPIYLTAKSLHAAWANNAALKIAGITAQTPNPAEGHILRAMDGNPSGILLENAMSLVARLLPQPSVDRIAEAIKAAQPRLWQVGLTAVHDFDRQTCFAALQILHSRGELGLRVVKSIPLEDLPFAVGLGLRSGFGDDLLRIGSVKAFADGALGPHTAAMFQPYEGESTNRGMLLLDGEALFDQGRLAVENGLSLAVHAIGDRANHEVLAGFAQLRDFERSIQNPQSASRNLLRHRIEHVQLIHPDDDHRLAESGIIASMQPIHAPSDMLMADRFWGDRAANAYAWRTLLKHGTRLAFGSDAPVESPNPFWGLHAAVTRQRSNGSPGAQGWYPAQRLSIEEALHGFTAGAAYAANMECRLGKLAPGYLADLLVLDTDPFTCTAEQLRQIHPVATMVAGEWKWSAECGTVVPVNTHSSPMV